MKVFLWRESGVGTICALSGLVRCIYPRGDKIKLKVFGVDRFQYTSKNLIDCSWTDLTSELKSGLAKVEKIALENGLICG